MTLKIKKNNPKRRTLTSCIDALEKLVQLLMIDDSAVVSWQHDCIFALFGLLSITHNKLCQVRFFKSRIKCICKYYVICQVNLVKKVRKLFSEVLSGCISLYDVGIIYHHKNGPGRIHLIRRTYYYIMVMLMVFRESNSSFLFCFKNK